MPQAVQGSFVSVRLRGFISCVARSGSHDRHSTGNTIQYATFVREIRFVWLLPINARRSFYYSSYQRIFPILAAVHVMGYRETESVATLALWLIARSTHLSSCVDKCVSVRIYVWQEWDCTLKKQRLLMRRIFRSRASLFTLHYQFHRRETPRSDLHLR